MTGPLLKLSLINALQLIEDQRQFHCAEALHPCSTHAHCIILFVSHFWNSNYSYHAFVAATHTHSICHFIALEFIQSYHTIKMSQTHKNCDIIFLLNANKQYCIQFLRTEN